MVAGMRGYLRLAPRPGALSGAPIYTAGQTSFVLGCFPIPALPLGITIYHEQQNQAYFQQRDDRCEARGPRGRSSQRSTLKFEKSETINASGFGQSESIMICRYAILANSKHGRCPYTAAKCVFGLSVSLPICSCRKPQSPVDFTQGC